MIFEADAPMIDTNSRPDNEQWLFALLVQLEDQGILDQFSRYIGLNIPTGARVIAEGVWPLIKNRYILANGNFDVTQASRDLLRFQPLSASIADLLQRRS